MMKVTTGVFLSTLLIALLVPNFVVVNAQITTKPAVVRLRDAMDIDGDGDADFITFRPREEKWHWLKNPKICTVGCTGIQTGNYEIIGLPSDDANINARTNDDVMTPGDYDGDGISDFSVWRRSTGKWYRINSSNQNLVVTSWGMNGDEPVARDYDGDGKTDLAVVRRENNNLVWYVLKSDNSGYSIVQWGNSTDIAVPGDYDGDGKFDLTVQRAGSSSTSPATFYTLKSSGGVEIVSWGAGDDRAVPGNYDSDDKMDYAVVREWDTSNPYLVWSIRKSTNGSLLQITYGLTCRNGVSDCDAHPIQNDYDGDGKTDIAVWGTRPYSPDGIFFFFSSSSGFQSSTQYNFGEHTDYPIASYDSH